MVLFQCHAGIRVSNCNQLYYCLGYKQLYHCLHCDSRNREEKLVAISRSHCSQLPDLRGTNPDDITNTIAYVNLILECGWLIWCLFLAQRSRVLRLLLQDNGFYPLLFFKTLWLVFSYSGYDDGGPNPECNHLFQQPHFPFVTKTLSDRANRFTSTCLELTFAAIMVVIKNLPHNRQESFRRLRSSWFGAMLSLVFVSCPPIHVQVC